MKKQPKCKLTRTLVDGQAVYTKQYREGDWGRSREVVCARAQREVCLLNRLAASNLFGGQLGLLRVVDAQPQAAQITTAEVKGAPLFDLLVDQRTSAECHRGLYLAGKWLRQFQSVEFEGEDFQSIGNHDPRGLVEYCDFRMRKLREFNFSWATESRRLQLQSRLERLVAASSDDDRRYVWSHGDYGPWNIVWDGAVLTPLDFEMVLVDRPLLDVTYFIHRLEMQQVYRPWKRWPIAHWKRSFLEGYGRFDAEASPMYRAQMMRHLLCRLVTYVCQKPVRRKQQLHNAWVLRQVKRRLGRILRAAADF